MKNFFKRLISLSLAALFVLSLATGIFAAKDESDLTVLFTHDLHSHFLPSASETGGEYGGYARLMHVIKEQKELYPDAILVDGGDFSMGSLFQTAFATSALELRLMGEMGYDATTFGNHEFDYLQAGLISMLNVAGTFEKKVPILEANYKAPEKGEDGYNPDLLDALDGYGVRDYMIMERGGQYYVLFGIFGIDSDDCAPNSGMKLLDMAKTAQATVDAATKECREKYGEEPFVICLSHSGTEDGQGEDYDLAMNTEGIDLIVSAHTHTTLEKPIEANGTYIVSCGEYGKFLGVASLSKESDGSYKMDGYELIPIDENTPEDAEIAKLIEGYKKDVENDYLSDYGVTFDQVLTKNPYKFETVDEIKDTQHESPVCNVYADAYKWAVEKATGKTVDVALTAAGVVRESLPTGEITTSDVFNAASLGVGTEGELIAVYVTGKDLKNALEVDASVQPLMSSAQLYFSGIEYSYNQWRMIFNKVDYASLRRNDGSLEKIDDEKLYCVVTGMYAGQMLGSVEETSMGLLTITPRNAQGEPLAADELVNYVVKNEDGTPVKEWYAISSYLLEMDGEMDSKYAETDGRKVVYKSLNPVKLLRGANVFTLVALLLILIVLSVIALTVILIIKKSKKKKAKKNA